MVIMVLINMDDSGINNIHQIKEFLKTTRELNLSLSLLLSKRGMISSEEQSKGLIMMEKYFTTSPEVQRVPHLGGAMHYAPRDFGTVLCLGRWQKWG